MMDKISLSPFQISVKRLINRGYSVIPLAGNSKRPVITDWSRFSDELPSEDRIKEWSAIPNANIGLVTGKASGVIALDFDYDVDGLHKEIFKICGSSPVTKVGDKGGTIFFKYNGEGNHKWSKDGQVVLELLSDGRQTVIPPSIHPNGKPYVYRKQPLTDVSAEDLPCLPCDFTTKVEQLINPKIGCNSPVLNNNTPPIEEISNAIEVIDCDDYDSWIKVGMGLKTSYGEVGFDVWNNWASSSLKYEPDSMRLKWDSFSKDSITVGTILKMAFDSGYTRNTTNTGIDSSNFIVDISSTLEDIEDWRLHGRPVGVSTDIPSMDELLRIRQREFTVVTGYDNSGKSEFLDFLVFNLMSKHGYKTLFMSPEKDISFHVESFVHRIVGKPLERRTKEEQITAVAKIREHIFFVDYLKYGTDISDILRGASQIKNSAGIKYDVMVIDPFNKITCRESGDNLYMKTQNICNKCSAFCKSQNIHTFLVAHPRTQKETDKEGNPVKLNKYSIAGGADFANTAENLIIVSRYPTFTNINIAKVRYQEIDTTGEFNLVYNKHTRLFEEMANNGLY